MLRPVHALMKPRAPAQPPPYCHSNTGRTRLSRVDGVDIGLAEGGLEGVADLHVAQPDPVLTEAVTIDVGGVAEVRRGAAVRGGAGLALYVLRKALSLLLLTL